MRNNTLVIIGGGAAGFFCAINAKRLAPRKHVIIVEKTGKLLSKVKISGGGRCNVTHGLFTPQELVQNYPRGHQFLKKALHHFHAVHTIQWFKEMGIELHQEADGRMFPTTNSSQTIIDCFLQEAERLGIEIRTHHAVTAIEPQQEGYLVLLQNGLALSANAVVLACGGYNQLLQYSWLQNLGLTIEPPVPSLFTFNAKEHRLKALMGVSASQAIVQLVGTKYQQQGPVLITHWGLSGPAAIKLSAWVALELAAVHYQYTVRVNWLGETLEAATDKAKWMKQHHPKQKLTKNIFEQIPQRLWDWVLHETKIDTQQNWADINTKQWQQACQLFTQFTMPCEGKTTYKEEFVTAGGIALQEIDVATMQLKKWPGIFVAGEVMNTDGVTGGFNFQNAWTTAFIAAKAIAST